MRYLIGVIFAFACSACAGERYALVRPMEYSDMRDASAAVAVSSNLFLVADDEDNTLRLFSADAGGPPVKRLDCNAFLELTGKFPEADLEGGARIGNRAYWIGSHGRNKNGKARPNRCRFFATEIQVKGSEVLVAPVGKPCKHLLDDLINDPKFDQFHLADAATRAPKERGALNIEGLSATPQGSLLVGFRNPVPDGKALLIPLLNPNEVIQGGRGRFGTAIRLDLGGLGVRDMACHDGTYFIVGGPWHGGGGFRFYRWTGPGSQPEEVKTPDLGDYHPEAVVIYPHKDLSEIQILSDDGNRVVNGVPGKESGDSRPRTFRSFWLVKRPN
jgi:hypothetical protein